jgi:hypothetical protein
LFIATANDLSSAFYTSRWLFKIISQEPVAVPIQIASQPMFHVPISSFQ